MQELRFVAVSEDGRYAVLAVPGRSARFTLPIDERLRAVALGQTSRLAQYEIEVESPLRPKEIQARIRAGETVEEIADSAGIPVERVRWFEGPVLAERAYMAEQAQASSVRRPGDSTPGPRLGDITAGRLTAVGADPDNVRWDARKRGDGNWQVSLTFTSGGRLHVVEWLFDPRRRHVIPTDDNAARMSLPDMEPPLQPTPVPGAATVTQLTPRLRHEPADHGKQEPVRTAQPVAAPFTPAPAHVTPTALTPPAPSTPASAPAPAPAPTPASAPTPAASAPAPAPTPAASAVTDVRPAAPSPASAARTPPPTPQAPLSSSASSAPAATAGLSSPDSASSANGIGLPRDTPDETAHEMAANASSAGTAPANGASLNPAANSAIANGVFANGTAANSATVETATTTTPGTAIAPGTAPGTGTAGRDEHATAAEDAAPAGALSSSAAAEAGNVAAKGGGAPAGEGAERHSATVPAGSGEDAGSEPAARPAKKSARGRRSSVPSWDEIMLGSSRQHD